jgi:hypothetical protein
MGYKTKEQTAAYRKKWYAENKHKQLELNRKSKSKRRELFKQEKVERGCDICGYKRCVTALHYHHIEGKQFGLSMSVGSKSDKAVKEEIGKCVLLCANCHAEVHAGLAHW